MDYAKITSSHQRFLPTNSLFLSERDIKSGSLEKNADMTIFIDVSMRIHLNINILA